MTKLPLVYVKREDAGDNLQNLRICITNQTPQQVDNWIKHISAYVRTIAPGTESVN